ncbi:DUF4190 domain-containing protein [Agromyces sp. Marseille-P2726]|uniref:DUF4190 domain-containing protein n=1 Tax=Agromyces sp. Marseille-P2726 TaxID=2709132 RepID=UPI0015705A13|nr:DUF4190 domain-containing protein [Agromyces sp. Marseille-P2726]
MSTPHNPYRSVAPAGWHLEQSTGRYRWWDGANWTVYYEQMPMEAPRPQATTQHRTAAGGPESVAAQSMAARGPVYAPEPNGFAIAAFILGLWGFLTTWIPLFIGLLLGGLPDLLAIVFGIIGIIRANQSNGRGMAFAVAGLVLGGLAFISIFFGAGTIW